MQKKFDVLQELSIEYGENLRWLPIPGDWHILYNYQKVLIKPYGDAGLMSLAKVSGYRAETLKSLMSASNFRRTHLFLLQCFEAFYEFFLGMFFSSGSISELEEERVKLIAHDLLCQFQELSREECSLDDFRVNAALTIADKLPQFYETFTAFMEKATKLQDTIKFWYSFLFEDCFPYLSLFIAIRYRNWDMRTGIVKNLAAMYRALSSHLPRSHSPALT